MFGGYRHLQILLAASLCLAPVYTNTCPSSGMHGLPGIPGFPGRDGRQGEKGDNGEPGVLLASNETKKKGEMGEAGIKGSAGKQGRPGDVGDVGPPGPRGPPGEIDTSRSSSPALQSAFCVSRASRNYPQPDIPIRFTNIITNYHDHFNEEESKFICQIPGTYYFVFHASSSARNLCVNLVHEEKRLVTFCDHNREGHQVSSGGLAVHLSQGEKVWLTTNGFNGMTADQDGDSVFSGFLIQAQAEIE